MKLASTEDKNRNGESKKRKKRENERKQKTQKGGSHCEDHFCCWLPLSEVFTDSLTETSTDKWQQQQQPQKVRPVAQVWTCNSSSNHSGKTGASGNVALSAEERERWGKTKLHSLHSLRSHLDCSHLGRNWAITAIIWSVAFSLLADPTAVVNGQNTSSSTSVLCPHPSSSTSLSFVCV